MTGESNLSKLLAELTPQLHTGDYVFVSVEHRDSIPAGVAIGEFREEEGTTLILERSQADAFGLGYDFVAAWITLKVHSSLEAVGLTAAFSQALARQNISCNVVAGFYHDHIFVAKKDAEMAMKVLHGLANHHRS
ncbi:MAG TPA: acetyltransferase [Cytophagales bacterium]|nr:acetyltransferase [Cytophagales bacterium]HAA18661.1 acetyltransferase [Cytophagales bacterium]HAP62262.1 acetyltransferase [Cytophagales bacterium]